MLGIVGTIGAWIAAFWFLGLIDDNYILFQRRDRGKQRDT